MIDISTIVPMQLAATTRLIQAEIMRRGWSGMLAHRKSPHLFIDRGDGVSLHIHSASPPTMSFAAASLVNDKYATHHVLSQAGIPQLKTAFVNESTGLQPGLEVLEEFGHVVVKPVDGGHGKGIRINVTTPEALREAVDYASNYIIAIDGVVVQQQFMHPKTYDVRVTCLNGKFVAAILRVPARVKADGIHTIFDLIKIENKQPYRGEPYLSKLAFIDEERAMQYLNERGTTIPQKGEEVTVLGVANYGAGGELVDVTDDIPQWLRHDAVKVANLLELPVAGVDYMTATLPKAHMTRDQLDLAIVEVNKCPSLAIHDEPTEGENRHVVQQYCDYLATL